MVSAATAFKVQAEEVPSFLMFNFDATSSTVEDFVGPTPKAKLIGKVVQQDKSAKVKIVKGRTDLQSFYIKSYLLITADGRYGKLVHCNAYNHMEENMFDVHAVDGIGLSKRLVGDPAYLAFAKTRNMNVDFYEWYWDKIVLPFIAEIRDEYKKVQKKRSTYHCREDVQIKIFSKPDFQKKTVRCRYNCRQALFITKNNYLKEIKDEDVIGDVDRFELVSN